MLLTSRYQFDFCSALSSIESVLLTLRHDFDPFLGDLFSVEPVLLALRYKTISYSALPLVGSMWLTLRHRCCDVFFMVKPIFVGLETRF